jgi:outer membrane protein assembly factor BamB
MRIRFFAAFAAALSTVLLSGQSPAVALPTGPLAFGAFVAQFSSDGTFSLQGRYPGEWSRFTGTWKVTAADVELLTAGGDARECAEPGRYRFHADSGRVTFDAVADGCSERRMIMDGSSWRPVGEADKVPERRFVLTTTKRASLPRAEAADGSWASFRGTHAAGVADGQHLPDSWDGRSRRNILWRTPIPGLAHSSPIVWGHRIFVSTAISSRPNATFKPGLYGDGDASEDRSRHRWVLNALDKRTGRILWERVAYEGEPRNKRHVKSTYASSTPATDGRIVVAWFGSQGVYAYDVEGHPLWTVDIGRIDVGAYDLPSFEWGPASSPIIWNGLVILQCDTQADSFLVALNAETGETVWKTNRQELPSWGTPTVAMTPAGPELVTNASNFIRAYDPRSGKELWRLGRSSRITAPTPVFSNDAWVVASGRAPERPIFVIRPGARGDVTPIEGASTSGSVVWSKTGRGPYMPTPLAYRGVLYVLANNGIFDAYDLATGQDLYRQRLPYIGSGYSASPVAADGKIYLSSEDGEMIVVRAGRRFEHIATNSVGELLMATPALSQGVMYVRTVGSLFAIGALDSAHR